MNMTILQAAQACHGTLIGGEGKEQVLLHGGVLDSRKVEPGDLFFATKGERVDGHSFIARAAELGAACVVCEKEPDFGVEEPVPYILVEDSFQALKAIAEAYRKSLDITVVGITGSVGKTSTKEFIAGVLSEKYKVLKTEGNYNNEVGLPLTILRIQKEHQVAVLEMGISEFGEMHRLSKIARPDICVITNIGQCHLENLKSREGILKAKSEIFDFMNEYGYVVLNGDDDMLSTLQEIRGRKPVTFGLEGTALDAWATDIESQGLLGSTALMHLKQESCPITVKLPGRHMIYNALAAACVGNLLEMTLPEICKGLERIQPVGGRSHIIQSNGFTIIDDCYNANPVSMKAALELLMHAQGRTVAILGDMFELGEREKQMHGEIGAYAMKSGVDVLLCVGRLSESMYEEAMKAWDGDSDVRFFETKEELRQELDSILEPGDTILVKASHSMHFEELVAYLSQQNL